MKMSNYVQKCIDECIAKNPGEIEFHQTVEEVLTSLAPVMDKHPEYFPFARFVFFHNFM